MTVTAAPASVARSSASARSSGPLALAQVVARGFAGDGGVAEDAEQVVAQLEGHADVGAEAAVAGDQVGVGARDRRAEVQRPLDGVGRGLVPVDLQRRPGGGVAGGLDEHVEVLPAEDLGAHRLPRGGGAGGGVGGQAGAAQHVVGPDQGEVAEQDRGGRAEAGGAAPPRGVGVPPGELDVHGRAAAAGRRGVHEVVVHERARLDQLEGADRAQDRGDVGAVRVAARPAPAPPGERRAGCACRRPARTRTAHRPPRRTRGRWPRRPAGARPGTRGGSPPAGPAARGRRGARRCRCGRRRSGSSTRLIGEVVRRRGAWTRTERSRGSSHGASTRIRSLPWDR